MTLGLLDGLLEELSRALNSILQEEFVVKELVSSDCLGSLCSISDDGDLVVEGDKAYLSIWEVLVHSFQLWVYSRLHALESWHVCHPMFTLESLVGAIWEFHQVSLKLFGHLLTFNYVITHYLLGHAHRARHINTEDYRDIFRALSETLLVLHLGSSFYNVSHPSGLWQLLSLELDNVLWVTELAIPNLLHLTSMVLPFFNLAVLIKHRLALNAEGRVPRGELTTVLETSQLHLINVGVNFLPVLALLFSLPLEEALMGDHGWTFDFGLLGFGGVRSTEKVPEKLTNLGFLIRLRRGLLLELVHHWRFIEHWRSLFKVHYWLLLHLRHLHWYRHPSKANLLLLLRHHHWWRHVLSRHALLLKLLMLDQKVTDVILDLILKVVTV